MFPGSGPTAEAAWLLVRSRTLLPCWGFQSLGLPAKQRLCPAGTGQGWATLAGQARCMVSLFTLHGPFLPMAGAELPAPRQGKFPQALSFSFFRHFEEQPFKRILYSLAIF